MHKDNSQDSKDVTITDENASEIKIKLPFLRYIAIESKLKFGFGILFSIILFTSVFSIIGLEYVRTHFEYALFRGYQLETLSLDVEKELLKALRNEKELLLYWRHEGVEYAKKRYLTANDQSI
ncbi:MAG: hypothetical protein MK132_18630 [Lentisphaerales bacterium]|nr:hypothetical protein [Lentisphaerales bacterium]